MVNIAIQIVTRLEKIIFGAILTPMVHGIIVLLKRMLQDMVTVVGLTITVLGKDTTTIGAIRKTAGIIVDLSSDNFIDGTK